MVDNRSFWESMDLFQIYEKVVPRRETQREGLNRSEAALVTNIGLVIRRAEHFSKDALEFAKNT